MKKYLLTIAVMALLASPSLAYVQGGHLLSNSSANSEIQSRGTHVREWIDENGGLGQTGNPPGTPVISPLSEGPSRPIPEPGTMALASLGLLALGVSRARRRGH